MSNCNFGADQLTRGIPPQKNFRTSNFFLASGYLYKSCVSSASLSSIDLGAAPLQGQKGQMMTPKGQSTEARWTISEDTKVLMAFFRAI